MDNSKSVEIISDEAVQATLTADQGKDAKLDAWKNVPFTKKGDNYASFVTGIHVNYTKGDQKGECSYVVKINPCRPHISEDIPDYMPMVFEKEGKFFLELLPELNQIMTQSGQNRLPFPKCYYAQYTEEKQMIIFEDLRSKGFKMIDRRKRMDLQHAIVVIQGLGRMHASSIIMQKEKSIDDLKTLYPFLFNEYWSGPTLEKEVSQGIATGKDILSMVGGHKEAINWLDKILPNISEFFSKNLAFVPPFSAICHGDCWINNILFKYSDTGLPVEVMFLDFQLTRLASLATDLNMFMFNSLEGSVRKPNVDKLLTDYYASFSSVMKGCTQVVPFTKEELVKEYKNKNGFGLLFGCVEVPLQITKAAEVPDMENISAENLQKQLLESIEKNPLCKPRFVAMFDEMLEEGLFS
ncbi:unnamed protein product [Meganyctiphanes norvegica]|uniref:CHK kinase-like domain-containing protein n=1 Tax=Meganyctiphanes norvegica TaxID=48144 RepID=A0AAV2QBA6_MEGNR